MIAAKLLVSKFQAGMLPVPGSPAIRESVELAHALLTDVEAFESVLEKREHEAEKKAAEEAKLEAERAAAAKKAADEAAAAQKRHDDAQAKKAADELAAKEAAEKAKASGSTTVVTPPK